MANWWYPTAFSAWGDEEREAIRRVVASDQYTMDEEVRAFEREFADHHGAKHGVMTNSGSSANLLAVSALIHLLKEPIRPGQTAAVPALAWSTTYAPLVQHGLQLRLMDVDDTWNWNGGESVDLAVTCSVLGNPCAGARGTRFTIEDNCESLGAFDDADQRTGTRGDLNTFSFFHSHQVSAIEGGMVLTDDDTLAYILRVLRAHGWDRDVETGPKDFEHEYSFLTFGYNVRPVELHAAVAREQLKKLDQLVEARRENWAFFRDAAGRLPIVLPEFQGDPSPFGLAFRVETPAIRQVLVDALRAAGIDCRPPTGGSFRRHHYGLPWRNQLTPNADLIHDTGLFLGLAPWPIHDRIEKALQVMERVL